MYNVMYMYIDNKFVNCNKRCVNCENSNSKLLITSKTLKLKSAAVTVGLARQRVTVARLSFQIFVKTTLIATAGAYRYVQTYKSYLDFTRSQRRNQFMIGRNVVVIHNIVPGPSWKGN